MSFELLRFTIIDWAVVALIVGVAIQGARMGLVNFLLIGRARTLLTLAIAPAVLSWGMLQYGGARQLAASLAIPLGWATTVGTLTSTVLVYLLLGLIGHALSVFTSSGPAGWSVNRVLGFCAGAFVGTWLAIFAVVGPSLVARDYVRAERQPTALSSSVVVPWVNRHLRPRIDQVVSAISLK